MLEIRTAYTPIDDNVQVDYDPEVGKQVGGIFLPQNAKGSPTVRVTVIAVGPGCRQVKPGDHAVIAVNQFIVFKLDGEKAVFTKEKSILAVVDKGPSAGLSVVPDES